MNLGFLVTNANLLNSFDFSSKTIHYFLGTSDPASLRRISLLISLTSELQIKNGIFKIERNLFRVISSTTPAQHYGQINGGFLLSSFGLGN